MTAPVLSDLLALIRHPRQWWRNATSAPCPVCGQRINAGGREWQDHKRAHGPAAWRQAIGLDRGAEQ